MSEHQYKEYSYAFTSKGLSARASIDKTPPEMYWNLLGLEVRQEGAVSSRLGRIPITAVSNGTVPVPLTDTNIHTLSRLKGVGANTWRYAGAGQNIYRITGDGQGAYAVVSGINQMSGNRFSAVTFRPSFSSFPYIFFADSSAMLKDNGTFNPLQQMGIFPPVIPVAAQVSGFLANQIDNFGSPQFPTVSYGFWGTPPKTYSNITPPVVLNISAISRVLGPLPRRPTAVVVTTSVPHGLTVGQAVIIAGVLDPTFNGTFQVKFIDNATQFEMWVNPNPTAVSSGGTVTSFEKFTKVNTTVSAVSQLGQLVTITPASMVNIIPGLVFSVNNEGGLIVSSVTGTTFSFYLPSNVNNVPINIGNAVTAGPFFGTIAASTTGSFLSTNGGIGFNLDVLGSTQAVDADLISCFLNFSVVANLASVSIQFDVGDGTFTNDFYSANVTLGGFTNNTWGQFSLARGSFTVHGRAGLPGFTWATVNSYRVVFVTNGSGSVVAQMDSFYMSAVGGPNVGPGSPYDYRYTYFNSVTGDESNPSVVMAFTVSPANQPVILTIVPSSDPQVTNINIYRRGGTLNVGWTFVAQIPGNSTSFIDQSSDAQIASGNLLSLTNDVPLTTTLTTPVNTNLGTNVNAGSTQTVFPPSMTNIFPNQQMTVDFGKNQETVIVQSVTANSFTAYFQLAHAISAPITASTRSGHSVNLMTIAFDIAWFAGDGDNPNRLYFSNPGNPESVPPQNWIEIGTPSDPIMSIVFYSGQLFVLTQARVFRVIIPFPGAIPAPYPTSSRHGLYANFALCISEGLVPYLSKDGVYIFQGSASNYASEVIEWLLADKEPNLGPVPEQNPALATNSIMAFTKNEFYVGYTDRNGTNRRIAYDFKSRAWRNDDVQVTAMYFEEDTAELVIAEANDGMIYRDRRGDVDVDIVSPGVIGNVPININLQTAAQDQGFPLNNKVYNELTLDMDCPASSPVSVSLLFDNGITVLNLGSFSTVGRQRIPIPINAGVGQISQNVALLITGTAGISGTGTAPTHFHNWHIKAAVEAEFRDTFDSYWIKFGTDEFKFVKQGWFEYVAPDPAGISFSVYTEGTLTAPVFTFVLPSTGNFRAAKRIRFPATKGKLWRMIGTSPTQFQLYGESFVEWKPVTMNKGYAKENLGAMISAQSSV